MTSAAGPPGAANRRPVRRGQCRPASRRGDADIALGDGVQPGDLADPRRPLCEPLARPRHLQAARLRADRRRGRTGSARLQPRRIRARHQRQHRPDVLRAIDRCVRARQQRRRRGSVVPGRRPVRRRQPSRRPLPLGHRLSQRASRPYLGLHRCAARPSGLLRRPDQDRRSADALGRADRSLRRDRRRGRLGNVVSRQRQRPQRGRLCNALRPPRRRHRRQRQLARRRLAAREQGRRSGLRRPQRRWHPGHQQLHRADAHLGARRHLQVGAWRKREPAQPDRARRVLPAARKRHAGLRHPRRSRRDIDRRLQRGAERLVPAGGLPVHAEVACRRALRPPRLRHAAHRPDREWRADRCRLPDPAGRAAVAHVADVRLLAVGVQPLPPPARRRTAAIPR